jgi:hypothetical protein
VLSTAPAKKNAHPKLRHNILSLAAAEFYVNRSRGSGHCLHRRDADTANPRNGGAHAASGRSDALLKITAGHIYPRSANDVSVNFVDTS